jgi:undecaprenyl-diphosphatase
LLIVLSLLSPVERLDSRVQDASQRLRGSALEGPMRFSSRVGTPATVMGGLLAIALLDRSAGVATARLAVLTLIPVNLLVEGLKAAIDRPRPDGEHQRSNASFPSSHAANAFALAAVLSRRWRRGAAAWWTLAIVVSASRIYLNRHFLSDVTVGALIGLCCAWLIARRMAPDLAAGPRPAEHPGPRASAA